MKISYWSFEYQRESKFSPFLPYIWLIWIGLIFWGCSNEKSALSGDELVARNCSSCHLAPKPDELDKKTWEEIVLPRMAGFMGLAEGDSMRMEMLNHPRNGSFLREANFFPPEPLIDEKTWDEIQTYILDNAPEELSIPSKSIEKESKLFTAQIPDYKLPPSTNMTKILPSGEVILADASSQRLYQFTNDLSLEKAAAIREGGVSMIATPREWIITVMGSFSPTEEPKGFVMSLPLQDNQKPRILIDSLRRPVHTSLGDLNGDGQIDLIVSEFGRYTGKLAWHEQLESGEFEKHILLDQTGAIRTEIRDIDNDGDLDIWALFGQGREGIYQFLNDGKGKFKVEIPLEFPASYGSSYFTLQNLDADEEEEILYVCGDNADFSGLLKPYHGVYIFDQGENGEWKQSWFYHLNGAYKAIPADFDQDGDLDFAVNSFFPDFKNQPEEGFVFLKNRGDFTFEASSFEEVNLGRWLTMDAGDIDQDGDLDIILGSLAFEVPENPSLAQQWINEGIPFIILRNNTL